MKGTMLEINELINQEDYSVIGRKKTLFCKLKQYYERQYKLLQGYEKDPQVLAENSKIITSWLEDLSQIIN